MINSTGIAGYTGVFSEKDESLSELGYHRCWLICGFTADDSFWCSSILGSAVANYLWLFWAAKVVLVGTVFGLGKFDTFRTLSCWYRVS